jgi:inorganic pyrophosphatase/exopolyphosphatase
VTFSFLSTSFFLYFTVDTNSCGIRSKQRIAEASQSVIWEQVADLTGIHFRIKKQIRERQVIILEEVKNSLKEIIAKCKKKYFTDKNKNHIASIGWGDKDNFNKDIRYWMTNFSNEVDKKLIELLSENIYKLELIRLIDSSKIETYISLFLVPNKFVSSCISKSFLLKGFTEKHTSSIVFCTFQ